MSFAEITILKPNLAEVIIGSDIEMDLAMVNEYHEFLLSHLECPFNLLINKIHQYSYTFEAQQHLATMREINSMAVVAYNSVTENSTNSLISVPRAMPWNIQIFKERKTGLDWLESVDQ
ncbi:MAG: hypothetical protein OFPI_30660 [Osedax symbiont Rs2]|nr:MAG: hypothetical protein OFPI_30660 [Osedax symbiont Rs2]